jgi:hypothetical protein
LFYAGGNAKSLGKRSLLDFASELKLAETLITLWEINAISKIEIEIYFIIDKNLNSTTKFNFFEF